MWKIEHSKFSLKFLGFNVICFRSDHGVSKHADVVDNSCMFNGNTPMISSLTNSLISRGRCELMPSVHRALVRIRHSQVVATVIKCVSVFVINSNTWISQPKNDPMHSFWHISIRRYRHILSVISPKSEPSSFHKPKIIGLINHSVEFEMRMSKRDKFKHTRTISLFAPIGIGGWR